tara:strand:- start:5392 stop:5997 length:606 start_codon:yes stop_codon:yes gene_type:complete
MSSSVEADSGTSVVGTASVAVAAETEVDTQEVAEAVAQAIRVAAAAPHWANASQDIPIYRRSCKVRLLEPHGTARTVDRCGGNSPNLVLSSTAEAAPSTPRGQQGMASAEAVVWGEVAGAAGATVKEADWADEADQSNQGANHRRSIHPVGMCIDCTNRSSWVVVAAVVRLSARCSSLSIHRRWSSLSMETPARRSLLMLQ